MTDINQANSNSIVILGIPDDRGVVVNHGRMGSRHGPGVFRQFFYRLPLGGQNELANIELWDLGDLVLEDHIATTHESLRRVVAALHRRSCTVIVIGGGHDAAYGSLMGLRDVSPNAKLVNLDAHLDVRPREEDGQVGSGSTFRRLIEEGKVSGDDIYLLGFHSHTSAPAHLQYAQENHMHLWPWHEFSRGGRLKVMADMLYHLSHHDAVGVSWDLDSICGACAPGVSAPATLGFSDEDALSIAEMFGAHGAIRHLELMELNPKVDIQGMTARLAAMIVWHFLASRQREE
jgi:formiminoglutamase